MAWSLWITRRSVSQQILVSSSNMSSLLVELFPIIPRRLASSPVPWRLIMFLLSGFIIFSFIWIVMFCVYLSFLLKTISSLKAENYVWFRFVTATSKYWYYPLLSPNESRYFFCSKLREDWSAVPSTQGPQITTLNPLAQCYMLSFP